jgi:putative RecB family exonuclease
MDIHQLRNHPHLSASSIGDYLECGLLYRLSRIDKCPPDFTPHTLLYGSSIHKVLADYNLARMAGNDFKPGEFQNGFETYWKESVDGNEKINFGDKNYEKLLEEGLSLLTTFHQEVPEEDCRVLAVEKPFTFQIEGMDIPIIGSMDLIEEDQSGTIIIADYKTANKAYSTDQVDKNLQMTIYQMAARSNGYGDREILLRLDCLIKTKKPKFEQYYTFRSDQDLKRTERKILKVWEAIQKGVFLPNDSGWKCNYCQYKSHCKKWFEGGD